MDKMKDLRRVFMENKFRLDKGNNQDLSLIYDASNTLSDVNDMKGLCGDLRKLGSLGLITNTVVNDEKKPKKKSLDGLAKLFDDNVKKLPEKNILRAPLWSCYNSFSKIKEVTNLHEQEINSHVIKMLAEVEDRCSEIQDANKKLQQLFRDKVSLEERLTRAQDQLSNTPGGDDSKKRSIESQISELNSEIDISSDQYLHKIFQFEAANYETSEIFQHLLEQQKIYHDECSNILKTEINRCHQTMEDKRQLLCFKVPLKNHLIETERVIAYPLEHCIKRLSSKEELQQEGLFRISGSKTKSDLLYEIMNMMKLDEFKNVEWPANVVADLLKRYLRLMPTQLLGCVDLKLWDECFALSQNDKQSSLWRMREIVISMNPIYRANLDYLIDFLTKVIAEDQHNKMNVQNICTVFVPNLFNSTLNSDASISLDNNGCFKYILETLLMNHDFFFPDSIEIMVEKRQKRRVKVDLNQTFDDEQSFRSEKCRGIYNSSYLSSTHTLNSKTDSTINKSNVISEIDENMDQKNPAIKTDNLCVNNTQEDDKNLEEDPFKKVSVVTLKEASKSLKQEDINLVPSQYLSLPSTKSIQASRRDKVK